MIERIIFLIQRNRDGEIKKSVMMGFSRNYDGFFYKTSGRMNQTMEPLRTLLLKVKIYRQYRESYGGSICMYVKTCVSRSSFAWMPVYIIIISSGECLYGVLENN
jgi:hypothetical protein